MMWRQLCARSTPCIKALARPRVSRALVSRNYFLQPWSPLPSPFRSLENQIRDMERQFDRVFGSPRGWWGEFSPFRERDHPTSVEYFRLQNPIIEEDGVKKFLLEFDVRRFKPEEITVKTNEKDNTLVIEAKHDEENAKYEFSRKLTLPKGVDGKELTCRFTSEGVLQVKAPYTPPPEAEKAKETEINVKHE